MSNKLNIKENWEKGLTLSKEEIGYIKGGDEAKSGDEWTRVGLSIHTKETILKETKLLSSIPTSTGNILTSG